MINSLMVNLARPVFTTRPQLLQATDSPTRLQAGLWAGVLFMAVLIFALNFGEFQLGSMGDDAHYTILAESLISSSKYGMINVPGTPNVGKYPFGLPMALAPLLRLFPDRFDLLVLPSLAATLLNISLLFWGWRWFSRSKSFWWGLVVTALYALSPIATEYTLQVMSEPLFTSFALLSILLGEKFIAAEQGRWWSTALAFSLTFMVYTRSVGIPMAVVVLAYLWVRTGSRFLKAALPLGGQAVLLLGIIVFLTPVQLSDLLPLEYLNDKNARMLIAPFIQNFETGTLQGDGGVFSGGDGDPALVQEAEAKDPLWQQGRNVLLYGIRQHLGDDIRRIALPFGMGVREKMLSEQMGLPFLQTLLSYLLSFLVIVGMFRALKKDGASVFMVFGLSYLVLLFLWIWLGTRLLYPILPQIQLGLLAGFEGIYSLFREPRIKGLLWGRQIIVPALLTILVFAIAGKSFSMEGSRLHLDDLDLRTKWIRENLPPGSVIMSEFPEVTYLYSDMKTVGWPPEDLNSEALTVYLHQGRVEYLFIQPDTRWGWPYFEPIYTDETLALLPVIDSLTLDKRIENIYTSEDEWVHVYRVQEAADRAP